MFWDYFGSTQLCAVCNLLFDAGFGLDLVGISLSFFTVESEVFMLVI